MAEEYVSILLNGGCLDGEDFCDFTLEDQNQLIVAKGASPSAPSEFHPRIGKNVCYIVAGVIINDKNEVLMIQEAKSSCAGQWYIPAGKVEAGESLFSAVKREVVEETGLEFSPTTLLMVETAGGTWFRFIMTGNVIGGKLKTPADADSESLQAQWVADISSLDLRAKDISPLIQLAQNHRIAASDQWHAPVLPAAKHYDRILMRLLVFARCRADNAVHVLMSEKTCQHLPVCELCPSRSVHSTLKKFMTEIFGADLPPHRPAGVVSVEYSAAAGLPDGICITLLVPVRSSVEEAPFIDKYQWAIVGASTGHKLVSMLGKNMCVALNQIR